MILRMLTAIAIASMAVSLAVAGSSVAEAAGLKAPTPAASGKSVLYYDGMSMVLRKGVRKVTNPSTGIYCIKKKWKGNAFEHVAFVGAEVDSSGGVDLLAHWAFGAGNCPNQTAWFEVRTYRIDSGTTTLANDVSFTFFVP